MVGKRCSHLRVGSTCVLAAMSLESLCQLCRRASNSVIPSTVILSISSTPLNPPPPTNRYQCDKGRDRVLEPWSFHELSERERVYLEKYLEYLAPQAPWGMEW